jgi:hypothetical protein
MIALAHALQGGIWFALAAGAHDKQLVRRDARGLLHRNYCAFWHSEYALPNRNLRVSQHTAAVQRHVTSGSNGSIYDHLRTVHIAGEHRYKDAARGLGDNIVEGFLQGVFCGRTTFGIGVAAVAQQQEHAFIAKLFKPRFVRRQIVQRLGVEPEVAGGNNPACRCVYTYCGRVWYSVRYPHELHEEATDLEPFVVIDVDSYEFGRKVLAGLCSLIIERLLDNADCVARAIDRCRELRHDMPQPAHVVQVAMGDDVCFNLIFDCFKICRVVDLVINARQVNTQVVATIQHDCLVPVFNHGHVLFADVFEPAQECNLKFIQSINNRICLLCPYILAGVGVFTHNTVRVVLVAPLGAQSRAAGFGGSLHGSRFMDFVHVCSFNAVSLQLLFVIRREFACVAALHAQAKYAVKKMAAKGSRRGEPAIVKKRIT